MEMKCEGGGVGEGALSADADDRAGGAGVVRAAFGGGDLAQ